jgi:predicted permease
MNDIRFAARMLRKDWGFHAVAIATLALGIGANTAIFSVVDGVILRPLAYRESERLVVIHEIVPRFANLAPLIPVNAVHFLEWRKTARSFSEMALLGGSTFNLTGAGEPERIPSARVSPSLFPMLGIQALLGRTFLNEEDQAGRDRVVVLNENLWRRRFAADPNVIGRKIVLDGNPYEVIGVLPASLHFPKMNQLFAMTLAGDQPQIWKPFGLRDDEKGDLGDFNFVCIARLGPGVTGSQALAELNVIQANFAGRLAEKIELRAALVPLQDQITGRARTGLTLILAAVGVVLLICCVNIANLLLARAATRRREIAIRSAIGASGGRLVRQMLVESLTLSALGGIAGVLLAYSAIPLILAFAPVDLPRVDEIHLDARILLFTMGISILAGLLFGFAFCACRSSGSHAFRCSGRNRRKSQWPASFPAGDPGSRLECHLSHRRWSVAAQLLQTAGCRPRLRYRSDHDGHREPAEHPLSGPRETSGLYAIPAGPCKGAAGSRFGRRLEHPSTRR